MKKMLFFFVLITGFVSAQTQQEIEEVAKKYFKEVYVKDNFKDPYSYEFQNIVSKGISRKELIESEIKTLKSYNEFVPRKERKLNEVKIIEKTELLHRLSEVEKNEIASYYINIDGYGANSYGNKVLGRYVFSISTDGKTISKVLKY